MDYVRRQEAQARIDDLLRTADQIRMERTLQDARTGDRRTPDAMPAALRRAPLTHPTRRAGCPG